MESKPYQVDELVINDMTLAAYLKMRGCRLLDAKKLGRSFKFTFERPSNLKQLKIDLTNSEITRFDDAIRALKRLLFSEDKQGGNK